MKRLKQIFQPKKNPQNIIKKISSETLLAGLAGSGIHLAVMENASAFPAEIAVNSLNGSDGFWVSGKESKDSLGSAVSQAGDFNGDGIEDFIIGAHRAGAKLWTGLGSGQIYVIFGKSTGFPQDLKVQSLNGTNGFVINAEFKGDSAGTAVGGGGDVNGDGLSDIIIGAPDAGPNPSSPGKAYIIYGSKNPFPSAFNLGSLNGINGFSVIGEWPNNNYPMGFGGYAVAIAKDINGDGLDEAVIGATTANHFDGYEETTAPATAGAAYVIFGSEDTLPSEISFDQINNYGMTINGLAAYDALGRSVNGAGDINGDGFNDLILGAAGASPNGIFAAGKSYVIFGRANLVNSLPSSHYFDLNTLNGTNGFVINGTAATDQSGWAVDGAGDVNGDGFTDLLIGAVGVKPMNFYDGVGYVVFGHANPFPNQLSLGTLNGNNGFRLDGIAQGFPAEQLGFSVSRAGDVNSDGFSDIIIGGRMKNGSLSQKAGGGYVLFGHPSPFPANITGGSLNGNNGFSIKGYAKEDYTCIVSEVGDVNGDGADDVAIGGFGVDVVPNVITNAGRCYVIYGQPPVIDWDGDKQADLIVQDKREPVVTAVLMTNGVYAGIKQTICNLIPQEKVVAVNDFDLDGVLDLATQLYTTNLLLRKGPTFGVTKVIGIGSGMGIGNIVIASGNLVGQEVKGKQGYPDLVIRTYNLLNPSYSWYYVKRNLGNWNFSQLSTLLYSDGNTNLFSACGNFLNNPAVANRYADVLIQKSGMLGKALIAYNVTNINGSGKFITFSSSPVLGAANFKLSTAQYEIISTNNGSDVYIDGTFSGYTLKNEVVVGPK